MKRLITLAISIVSVNDLDTPVNAAATFGAMVSFDRGRGRKLDIVVLPRSRDAFSSTVNTTVTARERRSVPRVIPSRADGEESGRWCASLRPDSSRSAALGMTSVLQATSAMRPRLLLLVLALVTTTAFAQQLSLKQVANGLDLPVSLAHTNDNRLFIVEQHGLIVIFDGTRILPSPFLDIRPLVGCCVERGLLGLAFHPHYRDNGLFYIYFTDPSGDIHLARYNVSATDPNRADPSSQQILLTINHQQFPNHNGGQLQFGPDGFLYIGTGDGGGAGDALHNGQNLTARLGKLLRIDVDGGTPYAIPPSNPFANRTDGTQREIWAYGLRNPWRFSFDRATGDLWIADVGQDYFEEVDLQPAGDIGGEDYGWNIMEGFHCYAAATCNTNGLTMPILEYDHSGGACSITGGYRYRGTRSVRLQGTYLYADFCTGNIFGATQHGATWTTRQLLAAKFKNLSTFGEDASGELYVVNYDGGVLYQIVDTQPPPPKRRAVAH